MKIDWAKIKYNIRLRLMPEDELAKNRAMIIAENCANSIQANLVGGNFFTGLFLLLNATTVQIGLINILTYVSNLLQLFSPLFLERFAKRKKMLIWSRIIIHILNIVVIGVAANLPVPDRTRVYIILGVVALLNAVSAFTGPGFSIWHMQSVPERERANYFSINTRLVNLAAYIFILGGGVSGIIACLKLNSRGFKTALISRGDPACCLSTGCIDVFSRTDSPLDGIRGLPPEHPYSLVGRKGVADALSYFLTVMDEAGLPYEGSPRKNRRILTPIGNQKTTCLVPKTMADADVPGSEHLQVISFKGLKDFYPSYITSRFRNSAFSVYDAGVATTLGIAALFDRAAFVDSFIDWLKRLEIPHDRVAIPAVLGMNDPAGVLEKVSRAIGKKVFEIPTLPPSIPGLRLFRALKRVLQNRGAHLYWGKASPALNPRESASRP